MPLNSAIIRLCGSLKSSLYLKYKHIFKNNNNLKYTYSIKKEEKRNKNLFCKVTL